MFASCERESLRRVPGPRNGTRMFRQGRAFDRRKGSTTFAGRGSMPYGKGQGNRGQGERQKAKDRAGARAREKTAPVPRIAQKRARLPPVPVPFRQYLIP